MHVLAHFRTIYPQLRVIFRRGKWKQKIRIENMRFCTEMWTLDRENEERQKQPGGATANLPASCVFLLFLSFSPALLIITHYIFIIQGHLCVEHGSARYILHFPAIDTCRGRTKLLPHCSIVLVAVKNYLDISAESTLEQRMEQSRRDPRQSTCRILAA